MKIIILASLAASLINFRGRLIGDLAGAGHHVLACAPDEDEGSILALRRAGAEFHQVPMARAGINPFRDLRTLAAYLKLLIRERPDLVIAYTQKPIIYGGLAARVSRTPFVVIMSGLGYVFSEAANHRHKLRRCVSILYRQALRRARAIFVFNADDSRCMTEHGIIDAEAPVIQVSGSGIDLDRFGFSEMPYGPPTFIMISRLMRDKGVEEFVRAAALVRARIPTASFRLLGKEETDNPTGLPPETVRGWCEGGIVEHIPECTDVRPHLAAAHVFVLPSYYREGLPRTLLEAMATGRPVITTDLPGCREPVLAGENGWLVAPRNTEDLADAMIRSVGSRSELVRMGKRAREIAEERFDVSKVNRQMLDVMFHDQLAASERRRPTLSAPAVAGSR